MQPHTILLFIVMLCQGVMAQTNYEKKGDDYYKYFNYERALREYLRVYNKSPENSAVLEKIIDCILSDNNPRERAIPYLEQMAKLNPGKTIVNYQMAQALFYGHRFDEALDYLNQFRQQATAKADTEKADALEAQINNARRMVADSLNVKLINLGKEINSSRADLNPFVTADHQTLFYTSDERFNSYAGIYYYNIKVSENNGTSWSEAKTLGGGVNTIFDEFSAGYSESTNELFFNTNQNGEPVLASATYMGKGRINQGFPLGLPFDMGGPEYSASLSATGDTIVFSGTNTNNRLDLFFAIRMPDNAWGEARLLPGKINSDDDDNYATFSPDGQRLYFASNRPGTMGGYDLYQSDYNPATKEWGEPVQLPYPINDTYDNMSISFSRDGRYAYIANVRPEGLGNRDIYQVVFPSKPTPVAIYRCNLEIKDRPSNRKPEITPDFMVFNTNGKLVAQLSAKSPKAPFIITLEPGKYKINITSSEVVPFEIDFEVPENAYTNQANPVTFLLTPKH